MERRVASLFGMAAFIVLYGAIAASILQSPWFNWVDSALSDLGTLNHSSGMLYNVGRLTSGLMVIIYSLIGMREHAPKSSYFLAFTGFSMQLVALICEIYGRMHFNASVLLFVMLLIASLAYFWEKRDFLALLGLLAVPLWVLHFQYVLVPGAAIPEIVSSFVVLPWVVKSSIKAYRGE